MIYHAPQVPELGRSRVSVDVPTWSDPKLVLDGQVLRPVDKQYRIPTIDGEVTLELLRGRFFIDPVPVLLVNGRAVRLAPPLRPFELMWVGAPMVLVVLGGAAGALLGLLAMWTNAQAFRYYKGPRRYIATGLITFAALVALLVIGVLVRAFFASR